MRIKNYIQLDVWKNAIHFASEYYLLLEQIPENTGHHLANIARNTVVDLCAAIAEGVEKTSTQDIVLFLNNAKSKIYRIENTTILMERLAITQNTSRILEQLDILHEQIDDLINSFR